jgi:YrbI family 3-deoxy-D-manno-octulosonate 8-phosphate phosphatase
VLVYRLKKEGPLQSVAIILARSGSKGVPNKNLATVNGRTLIKRAVASALEVVQTVYVSSDGSDILNEARDAGAIGVLRKPSLSADETSSEAVIEDLIIQFGLHEHLILFIQATSPFQDVSAMNEAVGLVAMSTYDSVFSSSESHSFIWQFEDNGSALPLLAGTNPRLRRQDLKPRVLETGAFYVFQGKRFLEHGSRFHGKIGAVRTRVISEIEIDTPQDLLVANKICELESGNSQIPYKFVNSCQLLAYDFDGVMTDNNLYLSEEGVESVKVNRGDGLAVSMFRDMGYEQIIVTTESNPVVSRRADKLKVPILSSVEDKHAALTSHCQISGIPIDKVLFIGNDLNDLKVMESVGFSVCPSDGAPEIKKIANLVLKSPGGAGVIREVLDIFLNLRLEVDTK